MTAKQTRRQHVVSRFYLKGFADSSGRVRRVTLPGDEQIVLSTADATVVKDFYTVTLPDGSKSDVFERSFARIEDSASRALRALIGGEWPVSADTRAGLSSWIALQHLRSEEVRSGQAGMNGEIIRLVVGVSGKEALRRLIERAESRRVPDDELDAEWRDITKPGGPDLVPDVRQHMRLVMSLHASMSRYLWACQWTLFSFERRAIVTADHPVVLVASRDLPQAQGVGIATAELFVVPLSKRAALTIQPRSRFSSMFEHPDEVPDFRVPGTTVMARTINREVIWNSQRHIYLHPNDALPGIDMPEPYQRQPISSSAEHLIHEEGLFTGMSNEQRRAFEPVGKARRNEGLSIEDLPWPIRTPNATPATAQVREGNHRPEPGNARAAVRGASFTRRTVMWLAVT